MKNNASNLCPSLTIRISASASEQINEAAIGLCITVSATHVVV